MKKKRALVRSAGWNAALCCVESLSCDGWAVDVLTSTKWAQAAMARRCSKYHLTPLEDHVAYLGILENALSGGQYDLFIPISDVIVELASQHREMILSHTRMILPDRSSVSVADDKGLTMELAEKLGAPIPATLFPATMAEVLDGVAALGLPCVAKLRRGSGSAGVLIAHSVEEVEAFFEARPEADDWPILQAYRPGALIGVSVVCHKGRLLASHSFRVEDRYLIGGTPPYAMSIEASEIEDCMAVMVEALQWEGPLDFDFIETDEGDLLLIELNPRFSGTTSFAYRVGVDMPKLLADCALGRHDNHEVVATRPGTRFRTGLQYELICWGRDPLRRTGELIAGWLNPSILYVRRWSDPMLLFAQVLYALKATVRFHRQKS